MEVGPMTVPGVARWRPWHLSGCYRRPVRSAQEAHPSADDCFGEAHVFAGGLAGVGAVLESVDGRVASVFGIGWSNAAGAGGP
jgi:hypothetical protein